MYLLFCLILSKFHLIFKSVEEIFVPHHIMYMKIHELLSHISLLVISNSNTGPPVASVLNNSKCDASASLTLCSSVGNPLCNYVSEFIQT